MFTPDPRPEPHFYRGLVYGVLISVLLIAAVVLIIWIAIR
jgi:hypothetical protein